MFFAATPFCFYVRFELFLFFVFPPPSFLPTSISHSYFVICLLIYLNLVPIQNQILKYLSKITPDTYIPYCTILTPVSHTTVLIREQRPARARLPRLRRVPVRWSRGLEASPRSGASGGRPPRNWSLERTTATTKVPVVGVVDGFTVIAIYGLIK